MTGRPVERIETTRAALPDVATRLLAQEHRLAALVGWDRGATHLTYLFLPRDAGPATEIHLALATGEALPSIAHLSPGADKFERDLAEGLAVPLAGREAPRPLLAHAGWPARGSPLRQGAVSLPGPSPPYEFRRVEGVGVYEVPVGPIHAGVIEPGHFRFSLAGEAVLHLEIRLGYSHRGVEKLAEGRMPAGALLLAERVSGDNAVAHGAAFCDAVEGLHDAQLPPRAAALRTILLEMERVTQHLGDVAGVLLDVAYGVGWSRAATLREEMFRLNARLTGSRLLFGALSPGGVLCDPDERTLVHVAAEVSRIATELDRVVDESVPTSAVRDRLETTGILPRERALALGCVGPTARASGVPTDARLEWPHATYPRFPPKVALQPRGDVLARVLVKRAEAVESARLIQDAVATMPRGGTAVELGRARPGALAWGAAEAHRGEVLYAVALDERGRIARCHIRDPSFVNWPALEAAVPAGNILADFPVINKSFNLSYAGNDR